MAGFWRRGWVGLLLLGVLAGAVLGGWWWLRPPGSLPEPPPRLGVERPPLPVEPSWLILPLGVHAAALQHLVELLPARIPIAPRRHDRKLGPVKVHLDSEGEVQLQRVRVQAEDGGLRLHADADIALRLSSGRLAHTVRARAALDVRARVDVARDWSADIELDLDYRWLDPPQVKALGLEIDLGREADRALRPKLREWEQELVAGLRRDLAIREQVQARWLELQEPLPLPTRPPLWLQVEPLAVHLPPAQSRDGGLHLLPGIQARLRLLSAAPPSSPKQPLPELDKSLPPASGLTLRLDVEVDYASLRTQLEQALLGKPLKLQLPGEALQVQVEEVDLYPSAPALVLALRMRLTSRLGLLDSSAWVHLHGVPRYDAERRTLHLDQADFHAASDHPLLQRLSEAMRGQLRERLQTAAVFDLGPRLDALQGQADAALQGLVSERLAMLKAGDRAGDRPPAGLRVEASPLRIELEELLPGKELLWLRLSVHSELGLSLQ